MAHDLFEAIDDELYKSNVEMLCVYIASRFVNTHPKVHDALPNDLLLKYFEDYLMDKITDIMYFVKLLNSCVELCEGDA